MRSVSVAVWVLLLVQIAFTQEVLAQRTPSETDPIRFLNTANELQSAGHYSAAARSYQDFLDGAVTKPNLAGYNPTASAHYGKAYAALVLFNPDGEKAIEDFIAQYPEHNKANEAYYTAGVFFYNQKKYDKAITYLTKAGKAAIADDKKYEALFKLGYSQLSQKAFDKADSAFSLIINKEHQYTAAANYYASYLKVRSGKFDAALPGLDKAEKDAQFKPMVPLLRTIILYKRKEYAKVIEIGEKVLTDTAKPNSPEEISLLVAESYYAQGEFAKAAPKFASYLAKNNQIPAPLRYRAGYSFLKNKEAERATEQLKQLTLVKADTVQKRDSLVQFAAYYLGVAYLEMGNKTFASSAFEQASNMQALSYLQELSAFNYGKVMYDLGKYDEAITVLQKFRTNFPQSKNSAEAVDLIGEAYLNTNNFEIALDFIKQLETRSPRVEKAFQRLAFLKASKHYNDGEIKSAIEWYDKALQFPAAEDVTTAAWYWLGESYNIDKNYNEAVKAYSALFKVNNAMETDYYIKGRYGIAYAYFNLKQYDKAIGHYQEYAKKLERAENRMYYLDALVRMADCQYATKAFDAALATYQKAIIQGSTDADYATYMRGVVYAFNQNKGQAKIAFSELIKNYPKSIYRDDALYQLANQDFEEGEYAQSAKLFTELINSNVKPQVMAYSYLRRANAYNNLKEPEKAIADYKKVLNDYAAYPASKTALLGLQEALTATGSVEEFNEYLAKFKTANPEGNSTEKIEFETAKSLYFSQKYDKAKTGLDAFLTSYPTSSFANEARFYLAECQYRAGEKAASLESHKLLVQEGKGSFFNRSLSRVAELSIAENKPADALIYYKQFLGVAKNKKEQFIALAGLMDAFYLQQQYDSSSYYANMILERESIPADIENKAALYKGKLEMAQGNFEAAIDQFVTTLNGAKDVNGAEAQYLLAEILHKQAKYRESLEKCFELNKIFAAYSLWYDKSFLLIADNYIALKEDYQATYTLEKIIDKSPNPATVEAARVKLSKLKGQ